MLQSPDKERHRKMTELAGLVKAKQALEEATNLLAKRLDIFKGLWAPARDLLLHGHPGNGKPLLAKILAHEAETTFLNIRP